ncbi:hypothetical protein BKA93DRAFT_366330 [Sparassis latifolia]
MSRLPRQCLNLATRVSRISEHRHCPCPPQCVIGLRRSYASISKPDSKPREDSKDPKEKSLEFMELLQYSRGTMRYDPSLVPVETMDLHIPSYKSYKKDATWRDHISAILRTQRNAFINIITMYRIAKDDGFPGLHIKNIWSPQVFRAQSTSDSTWLAPFRKIALDTYKRLNEAVASRDEKTIKHLTAGEEQVHYLKLARAQDLSRVYEWKLIGERSPSRVLSIRAVVGNMDRGVEGSRLLVQALVKFDTLQSLEVYSKRGTLLHQQNEPKPVVEYLALQKRLWFNGPWVVRDRVYEGVDSQYEPPH